MSFSSNCGLNVGHTKRTAEMAFYLQCRLLKISNLPSKFMIFSPQGGVAPSHAPVAPSLPFIPMTISAGTQSLSIASKLVINLVCTCLECFGPFILRLIYLKRILSFSECSSRQGPTKLSTGRRRSVFCLHLSAQIDFFFLSYMEIHLYTRLFLQDNHHFAGASNFITFPEIEPHVFGEISIPLCTSPLMRQKKFIICYKNYLNFHYS